MSERLQLRRIRRSARGLLVCVLSGLLAGSLVGCGRSGTGDAGSPEGASHSVAVDPSTVDPSVVDPPNVVIFLIDTLRADRLSIYGNDRPVSPRLEALAEESIVFERAFSPSPWTLPSVASLMLSQPICEHGVLVDGQRIAESARPLAERLRALGYRTGSYHANPYAGALSGLDRGFDAVELASDNLLDLTWLDRWLGERPPTPFFLYLHTIEPHEPLIARADLLRRIEAEPTTREERRALRQNLTRLRKLSRFDFARGLPLGTTETSEEQSELLAWLDGQADRYEELYDAQVAAVDEHLGGVIDRLQARGVWDDTLFVVASDHGEEMGEHGGWLHDQAVYQELVHVPLLVKLPGGERGGERIAETATLLDVLPTILGQVDRSQRAVGDDAVATTPAGSKATSDRGRDLLALQDPKSGAQVVSLRINRKKFYRPNQIARGDVNVVLVDGDEKAIYNADLDQIELYDLATDPAETKNLAPDRADRAAALRRQARDFLRQCRASARAASAAESGGPLDEDSIDPAQLEALQSLGYVGGDAS